MVYCGELAARGCGQGSRGGAEMDDMDIDLIRAAEGVLWKLSHNFDQPGYKGPARIDRNDASVRELRRAVNAANGSGEPTEESIGDVTGVGSYDAGEFYK